MGKFHKEEAPVTVLYSWCLRWNRTKSSVVIYGRRLVNGSVEDRFWQTSSVVKVFTPTLVITLHQSIYSLVGEHNWQQSNLDISILWVFHNGFPLNWKSILLDNNNSTNGIFGQSEDIQDHCTASETLHETGVHQEYPIGENGSVVTNSVDFVKDTKSFIREPIQPSHYSYRKRRRRGQTETEKLSYSLRYTGWQDSESPV